ncbi:MAG: T9SS type A sorting domain-containing protein [Flavipsychrobacter sp.]|nr:T9SS type A sorting domain-containing protein [Flavipsychrobacter sp.]
MKKGLLLFCLCCMCLFAQAQVEFTIPYSDSTRVAGNTAHVVDGEGNVFLLSCITPFYKGPAVRLEGGNIYGTSIQKIDFNNFVGWEHFYATEYIANGVFNGFFYPTQPGQIFLWNNKLAIPYSINMGQRNCVNNSTQQEATYRNGMLVLDEQGNTLNNNIFYEDSGCGAYQLQYIALNAGAEPFTYIYYNTINDIANYYFDKRNGSFLSVSNKPVRISTQGILFDGFAGNYVAGSENGIQIYDTSGLLLRSFKLPLTSSASTIYLWKIAVNAHYYVLNYTETYGNVYQPMTVVLTKNGDLISSAASTVFSDIKLTTDNQIWALERTITSDSSNHTPVTFMQMDLYQNIKRKKSIGKSMTNGVALSISNGNIIITGNCSEGNSNDSIIVPSQLYFYREAIAHIPLLPDTSISCNEINVFPNPATHILHIVSNSFNVTYGSIIILYNTLGQKLGVYKWDFKELDIDVSWLPKGMYYIQAMNGTNKICTQKIVKL